MKQILASAILFFPLAIASLPTPGAALEAVNPQVHTSPASGATLISQYRRRRVLVPRRCEYRNHRRRCIPAHYIYR